MKKILLYSIVALFMGAMTSCEKDEVFYDFSENPGIGATFQAARLQVAQLTQEMGGKVSIPIYRSNTAEAGSVVVALKGGEGLFALESETANFAAGENVAMLNIVFDYSELTPKPSNCSLEIVNEADRAQGGVSATAFTLVRKLTYTSLGEGVYGAALFGQAWPQEVLKAAEGPYYSLPSCYVAGTDFSFFCDGTDIQFYSEDTGYNYDATHGHLMFEIMGFNLTPNGFVMNHNLYTEKTLLYLAQGLVDQLALPDGVTW